ncbi:hypothetical protein K2173_011820 [Erythroxylum novogranatense]|uniref:Chromatin assembly factor 1 subunit FAS1 n=1 Tax=Erythroxylum novogranatense TaxID=1862640 RepID=A0AAV8SLA0_9ROSI|nr:hypothetical protein K2173_011820 [Erythroxylum novogranatense]
MADAIQMLVDCDAVESITGSAQAPPDKTLKRKRQSQSSSTILLHQQKDSQIEALRSEIDSLFAYYKESINQKQGFGLGLDLSGNDCGSNSLNTLVGLLMEESELPLSKLVEEIYGRVVKQNASVTPLGVKSTVLLLGQRMMYGLPNVDADVLEDQSPACLWCWETREVKLQPKHLRGTLKTRRICRKKINDRITAVWAMISALEKSEDEQNYRSNLKKALEKLGKVLSEADIRLLVDSMLQKNGAEMADKEARREEKMHIKQLEKSKREIEKAKKRAELEIQKQNRQMEKERKRLQEEAEKDEKRREKEELEMQRQLKKEQEEADKEKRCREKEEAELKKWNSIRKQASIMERFLKRSKSTSPGQVDQSSRSMPLLSSEMSENGNESVTQLMDTILTSNGDLTADDILKSHLSSWHHFGRALRSNKIQHWSIRQKPKIELLKELKLTDARELAHDDESSMEKVVSEVGDKTSGDRSSFTNLGSSSPGSKKCKRRKQLLQFDKSHRPAFYGIWPKQSQVVGPRQPFKKDPTLDYDFDSDEEWEEEDPGESLSDCDKDDEENLDEGFSKADEEEESEDGFFVPDGYLSESEGVQIDRIEADTSVEGISSSLSCSQNSESEEFCLLLQQQKYLNNLTESVLRKNQPLIVLNVMHEKVPLLVTEDLSGASKLEKICLQSLSMRAFPGASTIEISMDCMNANDQDGCLSNSKDSTMPMSTLSCVQDSDMPIVVSTIHSCSQSINKVVESLQQKFPTIPKSRLKSKVREISDFVDNHWQVRKEILDEFGMPISPVKRGGKIQNISTYFSKRCLPPAAKIINCGENSPKSSLKSASSVEGQQVGTSSQP